MTLGGIALAIGTVVDAGIVVVENIIRHQAMGKSPLDAARDGTAEVSGAIFAGTATTLAVFLPAVFLTGMIHYLFTPLSLAATLTIGASYFLAITVVPAYCATFLRVDSDGRDRVRKRLTDADGWYGRTLGRLMKAPGLAPARDCVDRRRHIPAGSDDRQRTLSGGRRRHLRTADQDRSR